MKIHVAIGNYLIFVVKYLLSKLHLDEPLVLDLLFLVLDVPEQELENGGLNTAEDHGEPDKRTAPELKEHSPDHSEHVVGGPIALDC